MAKGEGAECISSAGLLQQSILKQEELIHPKVKKKNILNGGRSREAAVRGSLLLSLGGVDMWGATRSELARPTTKARSGSRPD